MKQVIQRNAMAIGGLRAIVNETKLRPIRASTRSLRTTSISSSTSSTRPRTGERSFHSTTTRKAEGTENEPEKSPNAKSANLNASSGAWGKQRASGPVPRGVIGVGPVLATLGLLIVSCAVWGGYRYYRVTTVYPSPVRSHIRVSLKAMLDGDYEKAEIALRRAWAIARSLAPESMGDDPLLSLSGISIQLAECLERAKKPKAAFEVYMQTLPDFFEQFAAYSPKSDHTGSERHPGWSTVPLTGKGRLRAVGIANRAAMHAQALQGTAVEPPDCSSPAASPQWTKSWEEIEMFLKTFSVTQILYLTSNTTGIPTAALSTSPDLDNRLPTWLRRIDLAAPCEGLADLYVRRGEIKLALPLYQTSYYFLLSRPVLSTSSTMSLSGPLSMTSGVPLDPETMCIAASVLTAMSAAALGVDNPKTMLKGKTTVSGSSTGQVLSSQLASDSRILAVRSWARESRYLTDLGRRAAGGKPYVNSLAAIDILGREDDERSKSRKGKGANTQPQDVPKVSASGDIDLAEKDKRLVQLDLERIQEAERRFGEIALQDRVSSESGAVRTAKMTANPTCERTWAVVLYNTGIVEMMDGNYSIAEDYLQLALEQSRRTNLLEGVARSKAALKTILLGGKGKS